MALIECPECNKRVSDAAIKCPRCGYPINGSKSNEYSVLSEKNIKYIIGSIVCVAVVAIILIVSNNSSRSSSNSGYTGGYSSSYLNDSGTDASSIFRNLKIDDFSCSSGKHYGSLSCRVTNNNSFTVTGYFRVNFYDARGNLLCSQLVSLPDVAPGETVVCSALISKDKYPHDYSKVGFSQESLIKCK